jgi:hypothetical protein
MRDDRWTTATWWLGDQLKGVWMKLSKKVIANSAATAAVISVLVSVVGAGTKWMGN